MDSYITKGKSICEINAIPRKVLELVVIDAVLDFFEPLLEKGGRSKLADAAKTQIGSELEELAVDRKRAHKELNKIKKTISNLLDNITHKNREYIERQLNELKQQREQLETRLEELDRFSLSQAEIDSIVTDSMKFLSGLEFTLRQGLPEEKLVALRQCIEKIWVNKPASQIKLAIRIVPAGNLQATKKIKASI